MGRWVRVGISLVASVATAAPLAWLAGQLGRDHHQSGPTIVHAATPTSSPANQWPDQGESTPEPSMPVGSVAPAPHPPRPGVNVPPPSDAPPPGPRSAAPPAAPAPRAPRNDSPPAAGGCVSRGGSVKPSRFQVLRTGVNVPMVSVGKDAQGNPGTAKSLYAAAWYTGSPAPGTTRGNVIVNVHANMLGRALGNDLHRGGLQTGDIIKVSGADGKVACYRFREKIKIRVSDYNPDSKVYHDDHGRPQLAIMTCWDRNSRGVYESRIIFYADRIA